MSKKRFTTGLESLFGETTDLFSDKEQNALPADVELAQGKQGDTAKKPGGKDFSSALASFLHTAFEDAFEEQIEARKSAPSAASDTPVQPPKPASGLDLLIRSTITPSGVEIHPFATRRITLVFDNDMLGKLKSIAKIEKSHMKDIVNDIVATYISDYERKYGQLPF
ncbi:MAG: hypothetical protein IPN33_13755 [Saprospiraceae bacterium]|nr:hypothetical protein [Saprospiraceae bacterium]